MDLICSSCNSKNLVKRGKRKNKYQTIQQYYCKDCKKTFALKPIKNKTYPITIILNAISYYNQGYSLKVSAEAIKKQYKLNLSPQTIKNWLKEFKEITTFQRIRNKALKYNKPKDMIVKRTFHHNQQPYLYQYHNSKIHFLKIYRSLKDYLIKIKDNCPNHLFEDNERCSQVKVGINYETKVKFNNACKLAELALKTTNDNKKRHRILQDFMLRNDSTTIAVEVPVYLNFNNEVITGHIDFLQLRFNKIHILDYKPETEKEKQAQSQVYLYALALSQLTKIPLNKFVCAYFDEKNYYEFEPEKLIFLHQK